MEKPAQDHKRDLDQLTSTSKSDKLTGCEKDSEVPASMIKKLKNKLTGTKKFEKPTGKEDNATTFVTTEELS